MAKKVKMEMEPDQYRKLLKELSLDSIRLIKSDCVLNSTENVSGIVNIKHRVKITETLEDVVVINHVYTLNVKSSDTNELIFKVSATFQLMFSTNFNFNEEFFDIYKNISLPLTTYPFFREFVFNTMARMNLPPLTLPLIIR
ncbi:protein-export chaperone SecB [bacterium]|nr:protein-export chaperone SecB [bacterium]